MEIFKDIPGYLGKYQISNLGNVKSLNFNKTKKENALSLIKDKKGYNIVSLWKNNVGKQYKVHRLVYCTFNNISLEFKGNLSKTMICHKDDDPSNNYIDNLFIGTNKDNINDMISKGRNNIGERNGLNKYTENQIINAIKLIKEGYRNCNIECILGIDRKTISDIRLGKRWKYLNI